VLATLIVVSACLGFGVLASAFFVACLKMRDRWTKSRPRVSSNGRENEMMSISQNEEHVVANSDQKVAFVANSDQKVA
jgi:hypothetical protein